MKHDESTGPEGYQVEAVETWIRDHIEGLTPPFQWTRLEGGHSNLTYRLDDAEGRPAVIRRPPQGELLPKAHDMSREWSLISALGPTSVPVPEALGFCESPDVTGAWFYVMGLIDGRPLYNADDTEALVPQDQRRKTAHSFIDVLGDLHAVDPDAVGLGELGKKENYVGRQLKTWYRSWTSSIEAADYDDPRAHAIRDYLLANTPDSGAGPSGARRLRAAQLPSRPRLRHRRRGGLGDLNPRRPLGRPRLRAEPLARPHGR